MKRVVSLYLPTWPTDRVRRHTDLPHDKPLVTVTKQGSRRVLTAVDDAAAHHGLKSGMMVAHAQALVPDLTIAEADPTGDVAGLQALTAWALRRYSPIGSPDPPDGILIDSTGCDHLFGGEEAMLTDLHRRLATRGIAVRIGMADTPGAAHAVARFLADPVSIVCPGGTEEVLRPLPVTALRLPAEIVTGLVDLGFKQVGQTLDVSRSSLAVRFGPIVGQRLDWALAATPEPIAPHRPESMPQQRFALSEPIASLTSLERVTRDLAQDIAADLEKRGMGARALDLLFERVDGSVQTIRIGLAQPSRDPKHFIRLWRERLETIDPGFGVDAVSLIAPHTEPLSPSQIDSTVCSAKLDCNMSELVDRLANLPSVRRVLRFAPLESDIPERSLHRIPALAPSAHQAWPSWPRPTRLVDPPEPVTVIPLQALEEFVWRGRSHRICKLDGPERIHGEWWRGSGEALAMRDYYRVEDQTGAQFWLVHSGGGWCLHGLFG